MKFLVLALALVGAASAEYLAPAITGYSGYAGYNGLGWARGAVAPAVTAYAAPAYAAPALATYGTVAPFHAPAITAYNAATLAPAYGLGVAAPAIYGNTWGVDAFGLNLWKKKKAAAAAH